MNVESFTKFLTDEGFLFNVTRLDSIDRDGQALPVNAVQYNNAQGQDVLVVVIADTFKVVGIDGRLVDNAETTVEAYVAAGGEV